MDSRHAPAAQVALNARAAKLTADPPAATAALKDSLGVEGFVKLDPLTATASFVGKTNGFLTGPSSAPAADVGLNYVKANAAALGLTANGVAALQLRRDYVDILGTHHLSFVQKVNGITVFGNGVKVNVAKNGRIINVTGSPVASLAGAPAATPGISAGQAVVAAKQNVGGAAVPVTSSADDLSTRFASGDVTQLVYFKTLDGLTLAYKTLLIDDGYLVVVDAGSGKILYRDSILDSANGLAWDNRPGAVGRRHPALVRRQRARRLVELRRLQPPDRDRRRTVQQQHLGVQRCEREQRRKPQRADPGRPDRQLQLRVHAVHEHDQLAVLCGVSVLVELALPGRRVLLGRRTASRTARRCTSSSTPSTTICWPRRSASPRPPGTSSSRTRAARARTATR